MNLNYETAGINFNSKGKMDEIATPQNICDDMSTLFDYTDCNRKIWMDMYCKTGNTLASLKKHGVNKENIIAICDSKQSQMLICRKLYGKILPEIEVEITVKSLEAYKITRRGQVYWVSSWQDIVKNNYQNAYNIVKFVVMKEMERTMSLEFTSEDNFQINNIIMNPPYNPSDLYIDFVELAHNIASENVVAITPAKWQAKGGQKNEDFRSAIVPYISKIVNKKAIDVFNIDIASSINYYLIGKEVSISKTIINEDKARIVNNWKPTMTSNIQYIDILNKIMSSKEFRSITTNNRLKPRKSYFTSKNFGDVSEDIGSKYYMWSSVRCIRVPESTFNHTEDMDKYKVYCGHNINNKPLPYIIKPMVAAVREACLMGYGTQSECESIQSYYKCKLIWYLAYEQNCGNICTEAFINVPDPGAFDHIFTDEELYKKYNITDEEINIIESVIK